MLSHHFRRMPKSFSCLFSVFILFMNIELYRENEIWYNFIIVSSLNAIQVRSIPIENMIANHWRNKRFKIQSDKLAIKVCLDQNPDLIKMITILCHVQTVVLLNTINRFLSKFMLIIAKNVWLDQIFYIFSSLNERHWCAVNVYFSLIECTS